MKTKVKLNNRDIKVFEILKAHANKEGLSAISYGEIAKKIDDSVVYTSIHHNIISLIKSGLIEIESEFTGGNSRVYRVLDPKSYRPEVSAPLGSKQDAIAALKYLIENSKKLEEENKELLDENNKLRNVLDRVKETISA